MKLLLGEMYSEVIAVELRARGHDALSVREMAPTLAGAPDEELLSNAVAQGRTLLTDNVRDYRPLETALLAGGGDHAGMVYTTDRQFPRGDPRTVGRLVLALDALLVHSPQLGDRSIFLR